MTMNDIVLEKKQSKKLLKEVQNTQVPQIHKTPFKKTNLSKSKSNRSDDIDEDEMNINATHYLANKSNKNILNFNNSIAPRMSDFSTLGPVIPPNKEIESSPFSSRKNLVAKS